MSAIAKGFKNSQHVRAFSLHESLDQLSQVLLTKKSYSVPDVLKPPDRMFGQWIRTSHAYIGILNHHGRIGRDTGGSSYAAPALAAGLVLIGSYLPQHLLRSTGLPRSIDDATEALLKQYAVLQANDTTSAGVLDLHGEILGHANGKTYLLIPRLGAMLRWGEGKAGNRIRKVRPSIPCSYTGSITPSRSHILGLQLNEHGCSEVGFFLRDDFKKSHLFNGFRDVLRRPIELRRGFAPGHPMTRMIKRMPASMMKTYMQNSPIRVSSMKTDPSSSNIYILHETQADLQGFHPYPTPPNDFSRLFNSTVIMNPSVDTLVAVPVVSKTAPFTVHLERSPSDSIEISPLELDSGKTVNGEFALAITNNMYKRTGILDFAISPDNKFIYMAISRRKFSREPTPLLGGGEHYNLRIRHRAVADSPDPGDPDKGDVVSFPYSYLINERYVSFLARIQVGSSNTCGSGLEVLSDNGHRLAYTNLSENFIEEDYCRSIPASRDQRDRGSGTVEHRKFLHMNEAKTVFDCLAIAPCGTLLAFGINHSSVKGRVDHDKVLHDTVFRKLSTVDIPRVMANIEVKHSSSVKIVSLDGISSGSYLPVSKRNLPSQ